MVKTLFFAQPRFCNKVLLAAACIICRGTWCQSAEVLAPWKLVTDKPAFSVRDSAGEVVFRDRMWILGGWYSSTTKDELRDAWSSADGVNWTRATDRAPWKHPQHPVALVFDDKMWMLSGYQGGRLPGSDQTSSVWWSTDGEMWSCATPAAPWAPRFAAGGAVFDGKMWIFGGSQFPGGAVTDSAVALNDVWNSVDGVHWNKVTEHAPWSPRGYQRVLVYDNKLWLLGGGNYRTPQGKIIANNDVWTSSDGRQWTRVTEHAAWSPRIWHEAIVFNNEMWILGGGSGEDAVVLNDVWHSSDGVTWTQEKTDNIWSPRHEMSVYDFRDHLWVVGGGVLNKAGTTNEVWTTKVVRE